MLYLFYGALIFIFALAGKGLGHYHTINSYSCIY